MWNRCPLHPENHLVGSSKTLNDCWILMTQEDRYCWDIFPHQNPMDHLYRLEKAVAKFCGSYGLLDTNLIENLHQETETGRRLVFTISSFLATHQTRLYRAWLVLKRSTTTVDTCCSHKSDWNEVSEGFCFFRHISRRNIHLDLHVVW